MGDKAKHYAQLMTVLTIFIVVYVFFLSPLFRHLSLYILVLAGLLSARKFPFSVILTNFLGIVLLLFDMRGQWRFLNIPVAALLAGLMLVPYRFDRLSRKSREAAAQRYARQLERLKELSADIEEYDSHRQSLQQEIEKINQLYVIGRELVEHTEMADVLEHLGKAFLNRPGVSGMAVFLWVKRDWECAYCYPPEAISGWTAFMKEKNKLSQESKFQVLESPAWVRDKAVVFWPVRIERYPLASILLTTDRDAATRYMDEGAIFIPQVALGIKRMQLFTEVKERARNDGLTGLFVRRYFMERLAAEIQRSKRYKSWFSICMIDIDFFKRVNDTYGHLMGDRVLCALSRIFVDCTPPGGLVGRYGGEEFVVLIPNASMSEVMHVAREISRMVSVKEFVADHAVFSVTVSIGISHFPGDGESSDALISAADKALYWVKQNGRNGIQEFQRLT